ncbi:MAG: S8 family serine peptidase [Bacteroidia bacterium]|nr:S8 family serine peptidase [Bacteroidia bacterium]
MRNVPLIVLLSTILALPAFGQGNFWVFFSDKGPEAAEFARHPETLLSEASWQKREKMGLKITFSDLPVSQQYVRTLREAGYEVVGKSKWLNAVAVATQDDPKELLEKFSFVKGIRPVARITTAQAGESVSLPPPNDISNDHDSPGPFQYGVARWQNQMLGVPYLHAKGLTGKGVTMAIFDAGFFRVDTLAAFDSLWADGRITHYYDFVDHDTTLFQDSHHGLCVLSVIGANQPGKMVGTAPHTTFILGRTEVTDSESRQEEYNWVEGMEWADSIGVDIIHTSLGYNSFDAAEENYSFEQLDGNTSVITRAADLAAARGILVTTSAGNEGWSAWRRINVPCDGDSVLCIGSVDSLGRHSAFSSVGPTADGRMKPEVVAMGSRTAVVGKGGRIWYSNGTSYAAPLVAGLAACLIQGHPERNNFEIMEAIRLSGNRQNQPDSLYGYGIPNGRVADSLLTQMDLDKANGGPNLTIFIPESDTHFPWFILEPCKGCSPIKTVYLKRVGEKDYFPVDPSKTGTDGTWTFSNLRLERGKHHLKVGTEDGKEKIILLDLRK